MANPVYRLDHDLRFFFLLLGTPILCSLFLVFRSFILPPAPATKALRARASERAHPSAWQIVNEELRTGLDRHGRFWWHKTGILLAELLHDAGYTQDRQRDVLRLFGWDAVPLLGLERESGAAGWKSFMTDDHHPIELSWDWHTGQQAPTVRFSIEPVSRAAGTMKDPENWSGDRQFRQVLPRILPAMDTQWLRHFDQALSPAVPPEGFMEGHPSKVFYALDLDGADQTGKIYYFPGFEARATHQTNLDVLVRAIQTAPRCSDSPQHLPAALGLFQAFVRDPSTAPLELDMMAIDLVDPARSRIKIYFRSRETSFASVRRTMSLGGRVSDPWLQPGLRNLKRLWDHVLDQGDVPEEGALRGTTSTHRTGGMLYNVEFRLGSGTPRVKIYIPVRHYARSDWQVFTGLREYMRGGEADGQARASIPHYGRALGTIFRTSALENQTGIHTYIGCSVQRGGGLRVVSYINGQTDKFRPEWSASN